MRFDSGISLEFSHPLKRLVEPVWKRPDGSYKKIVLGIDVQNSNILILRITEKRMENEPTVLGINRTQDASICLIKTGTQIFGVQKERLTRKKHHWGRVGDLSTIYVKRIPSLREKVDLVVECYSSDPEIANLEAYEAEIRQNIRFSREPSIHRISHHLAHLYSSYFISPFDEAAVMVIDCAGSRAVDFTEDIQSSGTFAPGDVEVASFYHCRDFEVACATKQTWENDWSKPVGLGCFYFLLTRTLFPGEGHEGKVMGLAPYGRIDHRLPRLRVENERVFIPKEWLEVFSHKNRFSHFSGGEGSFQVAADLAATGQFFFEEALLEVARWLHRKTGSENLCYAGGTALNCVANGRLLRESPFKNVFVPPSPHDGGTALGCAIFGVVEHFGVKKRFPWINDYQGFENYSEAQIIRTLSEFNRLIIEKPADLIGHMADQLSSGKVLSLFQGRSELGPRALGHRSILADPRSTTVRDWINLHVKGRERFRPLAPVVLLEQASKFFEIDRPVTFMQFVADVREEFRAIIPAVTHVDGSARLQTISYNEDAFLYRLIQAFERIAGVPIILNTSLNGMGEPIVETIEEAVTCLKSSALDALIIPPFYITKCKNGND